MTEVAIILTRFLIFLNGLLLGVFFAPALEKISSVVMAADRCETSITVERMAAEFRSIRLIPGHFNGGPWNEEVDQWMGRKHKLMLELGSHLGRGECDKSQITGLLGPPDRIAHEGDHLFSLIISLPGYAASTGDSYEFIVYFWRGMHDFMFFVSQDGMIISSDWWYAGD